MTIRVAFLALLAAVPARAGFETYEKEVSVRLWAGSTRQEMFDSRVAIVVENATRGAGSWAGSIGERDLRGGMAGGFELSYGFNPWLKGLIALEGRGASAEGEFTGFGPNAVTDPVAGYIPQRVRYLGRYSAFGQELGATVLMREFGWCRFGVTARAGRYALAGAVERGSEEGALAVSWWSRDLSASAPTALVGVEWEWFAPWRAFPVKGFITGGYRWLEFTRVEASYNDSSGLSVSGPYTNSDGRRRILDFSGLEFRFGLQIVTSLAVKGSERLQYR